MSGARKKKATRKQPDLRRFTSGEGDILTSLSDKASKAKQRSRTPKGIPKSLGCLETLGGTSGSSPLLPRSRHRQRDVRIEFRIRIQIGAERLFVTDAALSAEPVTQRKRAACRTLP